MDEFIEIKDGEFNDHQYITSMSGGKDSKNLAVRISVGSEKLSASDGRQNVGAG